MEFHHIVHHDGDMDGEVERNEDGSAPPIWAEVITIFFLSILWFGVA